uniref:NADH-ubiquinone oxidoreductase chain 6 n=1 Tax=Plethodon petraeus TaxID=154587 RepID=Q644S1_9SALA|nr:NADH dehydrogenase subunit 6 [Plethodon petraeus]
MVYTNMLVLVGLIIGFIIMASNPSPYFAALGLVMGAVCGCGILVSVGVSFLSLVLMLIYLGGMLVVFAYAASLAAESYPKLWTNWFVLMYAIMVCVGGFIYILAGDVLIFDGLFMGDNEKYVGVGQDTSGVGLMYGLGKVVLVISGWALLLTLFVVLGITWGFLRGPLRAV